MPTLCFAECRNSYPTILFEGHKAMYDEKPVGYYLWRSANRWIRHFGVAVAEVGLSHSQFFVLASVHDLLLLRINFYQAGINLTDLGIFCGLRPHIGLDELKKR